MDTQLKRGVLDALVLSTLLKADSYGYQIIKDGFFKNLSQQTDDAIGRCDCCTLQQFRLRGDDMPALYLLELHIEDPRRKHIEPIGIALLACRLDLGTAYNFFSVFSERDLTLVHE